MSRRRRPNGTSTYPFSDHQGSRGPSTSDNCTSARHRESEEELTDRPTGKFTPPDVDVTQLDGRFAPRVWRCRVVVEVLRSSSTRNRSISWPYYVTNATKRNRKQKEIRTRNESALDSSNRRPESTSARYRTRVRFPADVLTWRNAGGQGQRVGKSDVDERWTPLVTAAGIASLFFCGTIAATLLLGVLCRKRNTVFPLG